MTENIDASVVRRDALYRRDKRGETTVIHFHAYDDNNDLCNVPGTLHEEYFKE